MKQSDPIMYLSLEQRKLVSNSTRIKILHVLKEKARTAKQTADILHKTPGSIHYHIKLLHEGGLLDLVKTQLNGGVLEKYYRSKTTVFQTKEMLPIKGKQIGYAGTRLSLTPKNVREFLDELNAFLGRWESRVEPETGSEKEIEVSCVLSEIIDEEV